MNRKTVIDRDELRAIREVARKQAKPKRNWYTDAERLARVDAALEEFGFRSSNQFLNRAVDWYLAALREAQESPSSESKRKVTKR